MHGVFFFHCIYYKKNIFGHDQESILKKKNDQNEKEIVGGLHISVEDQEDILLWFAEF